MKSHLLKILVAIAILALGSVSALAEILTGSCGSNATWTLDTETGLLKIEGTGAMTNYSSGSYVPWSKQRMYLTKVEIANGITSLGNYAFYNCMGLTSVTIGNSVTSIGDWAFYQCSGLTSVIIPDSVTSIGKSAFGRCLDLTTVTIGKSVTNIEDSAFRNSSHLRDIWININSIEAWCINTINKYFGDRGQRHIIMDGKELTTITIPNTVTSIESYAFLLCFDLTSVTIPNSVTSIGDYAFGGCYFSEENFKNMSSCTSSYNWGATICDLEQEDGLIIKDSVVVYCRQWATSVTIPNFVTSISDWAFTECSGLTSVTIGNSVTSIGNWIFSGCSSLTSVTIGNSVTSIGERAFVYCTNLTEIICEASIPPTVGSFAFEEVSISSGTLYVPEESIEAYKNAEYWKDWRNIKAIPVEKILIESMAFDDANIEIMAGTSGKLKVTILPANATKKTLQWVSTNPAVLSIDSNGIYTAKSVGKATVMAISQDGSGQSAMCNVTVIPFVYAINDNVSSFAVNEATTYDNATYTRTYTGDWEALYVPFCLDVEAVGEDYDVAEIYNIHQYDENYDNNPDYTVLEIKKMTTGLTEPNTPYLIRAKHAGENTMTMTDATIYPTRINSLDCSSVHTQYTFTGSYETSTLSDIYTIQDGELKLSEAPVAPFRWYMAASTRKGTPAQLPARIKIMTVEDVIDGLDNLNPDLSPRSGEMYDLQGRKVQKPQKGIFIQDGKKVAIK